MPAVRVALGVEIGKAIQLGISVRVVLVHHVNLQFAEAAPELDLTIRRQILPVEQQHLILEKRAIDGVEQRNVHAACEVDIENLGAERGRQPADAERPGDVCTSLRFDCGHDGSPRKNKPKKRRAPFVRYSPLAYCACGGSWPPHAVKRQADRLCFEIGSSRIRLPVAAKMALVSAGMNGGTPGSPTPPGGKFPAVTM